MGTISMTFLKEKCGSSCFTQTKVRIRKPNFYYRSIFLLFCNSKSNGKEKYRNRFEWYRFFLNDLSKLWSRFSLSRRVGWVDVVVLDFIKVFRYRDIVPSSDRTIGTCATNFAWIESEFKFESSRTASALHTYVEIVKDFFLGSSSLKTCRQKIFHDFKMLTGSHWKHLFVLWMPNWLVFLDFIL